jgi:hypothetical protein
MRANSRAWNWIETCPEENVPVPGGKAMDVFKLAFETVMMGLFVLPCLWVVIEITKPNLLTSSTTLRLAKRIPEDVRAHVIAFLLFPLAYLLGATLSPVACGFLNDTDMLGGLLPTEDKIQQQAYSNLKPYLQQPAVDAAATTQPAALRVEAPSPSGPGAVQQNFSPQNFMYEENAVAIHGAEDNGKLRWLHERMTMLQGATFTAFALMVLSGFAWCGRLRTRARRGTASHWELRRAAALLVSLAFLFVGANGMIRGNHQIASGDMPIAEFVFILLGSFGLFAAIHGSRSRVHHGVTAMVAGCFMLLCYSGYTSTGASYAQTVLETYEAYAAPQANAASQVSAAYHSNAAPQSNAALQSNAVPKASINRPAVAPNQLTSALSQ